MEEKKKGQAAGIAIGAMILLLGISWFFIPFMYQVCDDKYLMQFASGQFLGKPSPYMIHIRFPISYVFSGLYKIYNGIDWYGTLMIGMQLLCLTLVLYKILKKIDSIKIRILLTCIVFGMIVSMWITEIVSITYTTSAAILGLTAIVWYVISDRKWKDYVFCILLMVICYNIRYETLYMVVPFAGVIWLYDFIMQKNKWKPILFAVGLVAGLAVIILFDHYMYGSPEWKQLFAYNQKRILLYDYYQDDLLDYEKYQEVYQELGMNENDRNLIESYALMLKPELQEKIQKLVDSHVETSSISSRLKADLHIVIYEVLLGNKLVTVVTAIIWLFTLILLVKYKDWVRVRLAAGFIVLQVALWLYLGMRGRIMTRVTRSMMFLFSMMALLCIYYFWKERRDEFKWTTFSRIAIAGVCFVLAGSSVVSFAKQRRINLDSYSRTSYYDVEQYCNAHSENFYFLDVYSIARYEGGYHYQFFNKNTYTNFVMLGDWMGYSPIVYEKLKSRGITNVQDALFYSGKAYIIASEDVDMKYLEELGEGVEVTAVDKISREGQVTYYVYQCRKK